MPAEASFRELDTPARWHAGAPDVALLLDDWAVLLLFAEAQDPSTTVGWLFPHYLELRYGSPSTDTFGEHPLHAAGASYFGAFEVLESAWLAERTKAPGMDGYHHYFLQLGDHSLELIAKPPQAYTCPSDVRDPLRLEVLLPRCAPLRPGDDGGTSVS